MANACRLISRARYPTSNQCGLLVLYKIKFTIIPLKIVAMVMFLNSERYLSDLNSKKGWSKAGPGLYSANQC